MDTAQWPQEIVVKPIEEIVTNTCPKPAAVVERKARSQKEQVLNCPRCNSSNTKFCYYNNYSLTQPRYFCKACRRYWTEGGSLRNIPVGGGSRKNKRSSSSYSSSSQAHSKKLPDLVNPQNNPKKINQAQDLNLSFQSNNQDFNTNLSDLVSNSNNPTIAAAAATSQQISALELLTGMTNSKGLNSFIPNIPVLDHHHYSSLVYTSGFPLHHDQFKPSLNFSLDGALGINGFGNLQGVPDHETSNGRILLPFEDLKQGAAASASTANGMEQSKEQGDSTGFWTGMLSGGSWVLSHHLPKQEKEKLVGLKQEKAIKEISIN